MGNARKTVTGSSYAAPRLAALLARLLSVYPGLPPLEAKAALHRIAEPLHPAVLGSNVFAPLSTHR
jgi:subtilisin